MKISLESQGMEWIYPITKQDSLWEIFNNYCVEVVLCRVGVVTTILGTEGTFFSSGSFQPSAIIFLPAVIADISEMQIWQKLRMVQGSL